MIRDLIQEVERMCQTNTKRYNALCKGRKKNLMCSPKSKEKRMEFKWPECKMGLSASTCFVVYHT